MDLQVSNSDLLVVAHRDAPSTPIFWSADRALHHTGGPILIVPETWNGSDVGRRIVVAWNGSRPARRAVLDALPLLSAAQAVSLLIVDSDELAIPDPETDVVAYLKRHGIRSEIQKVKSHGLSVAEVIAAHARKRGADLIVFGASSRHHGSDAVLGCATRSLLSSVPLPLFVSR
jgi:nucleotide-binding universal stress UspA family protein